MNVLHVIPSVAPRYGGPSEAVVAMCRALSAEGVDVAIATTDADGRQRLPVPLGHMRPFHDVPTIFFRRQASEAFKYSAPLAAWLQANVARFDLVHIHAVFSHACLAAGRACRRNGRPYVVRPLGTLTPWSLAQKPVRKRIAWELAGRQMVSTAAAVHYTTGQERRTTEQALDLSRGTVIGLGVDERLLAGANGDDAADGFAAGQPYVLILSRLHPVKRVETALSALTTVFRDERFARWRVVVAGDGEPRYVAKLRRLAAQANGQAERVVFVGWLAPDRKRTALNRAGLLLLPSSHESFGQSAVEALACGVPVIVSPQVGVAEEIRAANAGWVAPPDPASLAAVLADALASDHERARRGSAGRALVRRRFTWPAIAADLHGLYESCCAPRPAIVT